MDASAMAPFPTLSLLLVGAATSIAGAHPGTIADKTLVAWVKLSSAEQRGGSALTLFDSGERFDAIVFGEVEPGRWMGGSDFFRRTPQDQSGYPVESGVPGQLVQVAITYAGRDVTIYRNGAPYASYEIGEPQTFTYDATVLIGLRYLGGMGPIGYLAGEVGEARVYDVALEGDGMAALRPGEVSEPQPVGWWTFEDGSTADRMGNFPPGELCGGAVVADGALHLNGTDAYMVSRLTYPENQLLFYKALDRGTGNMWDTWLYLHEGMYYLYYLGNGGASWDNISMARSPDGVHWEELGSVLRKREGVEWMGTGSTWASPAFERDGRYIINYSEWRGPRQTIFFAESADLVHWRPLGDAFEFVQDTRWYKETGRWDCIYTIPRAEGGLFGYWTADPLTGAGVGFGRSMDGIHWEALEPPAFAEGSPHGEAGAVERIGDRYYLILGANGGMRTMVADAPEGPFAPAQRNFDLLAGQSGLHTYFARFLPTSDVLLVNHHSRARDGQVYFAPLKRAVVDDAGTLRLAWWEGNDALKADAKLLQSPLTDGVDAAAGIIAEGRLTLPRDQGEPRGLYIGTSGGSGVATLVRPDGVTQIGPAEPDGSGMTVEETIDREMTFPEDVRFRLLLKHSLIEFYLDDVLMQCYSLPARADGRIALIGDGGRMAASLQVWQLPRIDRQANPRRHA